MTTIARLVVHEPDEPTLELLCDHLTADRFEAIAAPTTADAKRHCLYSQPDLLLLNLGHSDASGLDFLRDLRNPDRATNSLDPATPVIVLGGSDSSRDKVRALDDGADDYLVKPFSYGELLARINAVLRRRRRSEPTIQVGDLTIDTVERTVTLDQTPIRLSAKEYALLTVLAKEPTRVFSKEELLREVWGYRSIGHTRTLEAHCDRLRKKLASTTHHYVVSCWGVGYRLLGP